MPAFLKIFTPPVFEADTKPPQAYLLHLILWTLIFVPVPYVLYVTLKTPEASARAWIQAGVGEAVNVFLFFLLYRGYVRTASVIQVGAFWLFFTASAATGLGVHGEGYLLGYPLVIVIAGIITSERITFGITMLSLIAGALMVVAERLGVFIPTHTGDAMTTWVLSLAIFPMGMLLQYLASTVQKVLPPPVRKDTVCSRVTADYTFCI
jgi:hypothetical protein